MQYQFTLLERIMHENLLSGEDSGLEAGGLPALRILLHTELERIRKSFLKIVYSRKKDKVIQRYLWQHRLALLHLAEELRMHEKQNKAGYPPPEFYVLVADYIDKLLQFMENHFSRYFDGPEEHVDKGRIVTSLTIKELALICRLFLERGIFRIGNRTKFAELLTKYIVSFQKEADESQSPKTFYNGLYGSDLKTIQSVRSILNSWVKRTDELYAEEVKKEKEDRQKKDKPDHPRS